MDFREQVYLGDDIPSYCIDFNKRVFEDLFRRYQFDGVIHMGRIMSSQETRMRRYNANVLGSQRMLDLCHKYGISREEQDEFAAASQQKAAAARAAGYFDGQIVPVTIPQRKGDPIVVEQDEHPRRKTSLEKLAALKPVTHPEGTVTAGNASGVNDGAAALIVASEEAVKKHGLTPLVKIQGMSTAGVPPRIMGMGPVPATQKLMKLLDMGLDQVDLIELNEAFASQSLACMRELGMEDDDPRVNPQGGAIALGHPLGMSGARIVTTAVHQLQRGNMNQALCAMCIGVGQGIAMGLEKV